MNIETVAKFEKSEEDIEVFKEVMMEQLGILMEWCMVEEMGHVVYFLNAAQSKEGMRNLIEELKNYPDPHLNEPDYWLTEEEALANFESNIEKDGDIWEKAFAQRYYPNKTLSDLGLMFEYLRNEAHTEPKSD